LQRFAAVIQGVPDALLQVLADPVHELQAQVAADDVAAERQRQPGLLLPPDAQVHH
jgi:hypothetical protein